jgi:hypothetical protein
LALVLARAPTGRNPREPLPARGQADASFVEATQFRQGDAKVEMRGRKIPVGLDRTAQLSDRFFILAEKRFGCMC